MNSSNDDKLTAPGSSREVMMDEEAPANGAVEQPRPQTKGSFSLWARLGAALAVVGITATSVAVPLSLRESDDNSSSMYVPPNYTTPFNETVEELPLLGDSVLNGYPTIQAFKDSLRLVAESYVNGVVARNVGDKTYENFALSPSFAVGEDVMAMDGDMMNTATPRESSQEAVNDYETNDQEEGVREGDNVVSNGVIGTLTGLIAFSLIDLRLTRVAFQPLPHTAMKSLDGRLPEETFCFAWSCLPQVDIVNPTSIHSSFMEIISLLQ